MISNKNFSRQTNPDVGGETVFERCNFCQPAPVASGDDWVGTRLFPGDDTPRTFTECNLVNCEVPPGSTITKCNVMVIRRGVVVSSEDIEVAGQVITVDTKADICYGRQTAAGVYSYYGTPKQDILEPENG